MDDEFRVEVELDDDEHGYSIGERLRALDLDDDARNRLGSNVLVTRDGSRLFLYAASEPQAREAERVVRELVDADDLTAEIGVTRWHPVEEDWKDASIPLPATPEEEQAEEAARGAAEAEEARAEGRSTGRSSRTCRRGTGRSSSRPASGGGIPALRRWRYIVAGAVSEDEAFALADRLRAELPEDADVRVDVDLSDVERGPLQFLPY